MDVLAGAGAAIIGVKERRTEGQKDLQNSGVTMLALTCLNLNGMREK